MAKLSSVRGRPTDPLEQQQRKDKLMDAAFELLRSKSYRSITIRDIARVADSKSAMVSYYFGNKEGLFIALLERFAARNLGSIMAALSSEEPIRAFIKTALGVFQRAAPILRLMTDDILESDTDLQARLVEVLPKRMATVLPVFIEAQQRQGVLDPKLDPKLTAFSLVSLLITPFITRPVRQYAWDIDDSLVASDAWADHLYQIFVKGAGV